MLPTFPTLPGIAYTISKTPLTSTRVLQAASSVEYRAQNWATNLWKFSIPIEFLRQFATFNEYSTLTGFILSQAGMLSPFLYNDSVDNTVTGQQVGIGNGVQTAFPLVRTINSYVAPVNYCTGLTNVSLAGVTQSSGFSLTQSGYFGPDTVTFVTPPASGVPVTVSFTFAFVCRFLQDDPEFGLFMSGRWSVKKLDFQSLK